MCFKNGNVLEKMLYDIYIRLLLLIMLLLEMGRMRIDGGGRGSFDIFVSESVGIYCLYTLFYRKYTFRVKSTYYIHKKHSAMFANISQVSTTNTRYADSSILNSTKKNK